MVLGVSQASFDGPAVPAHPAPDLTLMDAGISCFQPEIECAMNHHAVLVTHGTSSATVGPFDVRTGFVLR